MHTNLCQYGSVIATATTIIAYIPSAIAFRTNFRHSPAGGKAYTTSLCVFPQPGHREDAQSDTKRASVASAPGSGNLEKNLFARALPAEANRSTDIFHPASLATSSILRHNSSDTLGPRTDSTLLSTPKVSPSLEAPSIPSATSCFPGTCSCTVSRLSRAHSLLNRRANVCITLDRELPFRNAVSADSASFLKITSHPVRSLSCAIASSIKHPPSPSL